MIRNLIARNVGVKNVQCYFLFLRFNLVVCASSSPEDTACLLHGVH